MTNPEEQEAVPIAAAADALGVSRNRVYQLVTEGRLESPPIEAGRLRAASGTRAVTKESLDAELGRRAQAAPRDWSNRTSADPDRPQQRAAAAVLEMKVRLDAARDELRHERARSAKLARTLSEMATMLSESIDREDKLDDVAEGYSAAMLQLLGPVDGSDIEPT